MFPAKKIFPYPDIPVILLALAMALPPSARLGATELQVEHKRTELRQALQPRPATTVARDGGRQLTPTERQEMREQLRQLNRGQGRARN